MLHFLCVRQQDRSASFGAPLLFWRAATLSTKSGHLVSLKRPCIYIATSATAPRGRIKPAYRTGQLWIGDGATSSTPPTNDRFGGRTSRSNRKGWVTEERRKRPFARPGLTRLIQSKVLINNFLLLWPSLVSLPFAASFLSTLPITFYGTPPTSGSAALPLSTAQSFQALSPDGQKTFEAKYILFSPYGPKPIPGIGDSGASIFHDLDLFGWWYS